MNWTIKIISKNINDQNFAHFMRGYDKGGYDKGGTTKAFTVMCLAEWWAFEWIILMTGLLGVNELSATVVMYNYGLILYTFPHGTSQASISLIGNNLGANKPKTAKTYAYALIVFGWSMIFALIGLTIIFKEEIFWIYTSDEAVTEQIMYAFPVWIAKLIWDMSQWMLNGSMKAIGSQTIAAVAGVISYWMIMLPGAYIFGFIFEYRLRGIWFGIVLGSFVQAAWYLYVILNASWEKIATEASRHIPISRIMKDELLDVE